MADFRFRAAAALELRRQQETTAGTTLARAEALCREAEAHVLEGEQTRREAQETLRNVERRGTDVGTIDWHRAWIVRLAASVEMLEGRGRGARAGCASGGVCVA